MIQKGNKVENNFYYWLSIKNPFYVRRHSYFMEIFSGDPGILVKKREEISLIC